MSVAATTKEDRTGGWLVEVRELLQSCQEREESSEASSASPSHSCLGPPLPAQRLSRERLPGQLVSALTGGNTGLQAGLGD